MLNPLESFLANSFLKKSNTKVHDLFNLYNVYRNNNDQKAIENLNVYFNKVKLFEITKQINSIPLYIDNLCIKGMSYNEIKEQKLVSIIMTAHNEQTLLPSALSSIIDQTYKNIEIIFVDDASSDNTTEVFENTCRENNFSNYKIISMKKNSGPFITRNVGIKYSTGEYITFHDADDWAHPQRIEEQVKVLEVSDKVASISQLVRIKPNGELFSKHIYPLNRIAMVSLMITRKVLEELGCFYIDLLGADTEYFERIKYFYGTEKVENIKKVLTFAAHRPNSRTTSELTGTPEFGRNPLRERHWQILEDRLFEMVNGYKKYYIGFNESKYEYDIIK
ncbi:glycosyltransferase family 2 protein [Sulfurimonas microaerophilic]|uniref:glycosyltransferase family 2 protein n=1 Tax=Sulfurimonas microaerophilic TaxID=3058392 RepID=UPI0027155BD1|nr:glycosyltransferase family A protein [Sulfurimonas sp. hsl 1-7]